MNNINEYLAVVNMIQERNQSFSYHRRTSSDPAYNKKKRESILPQEQQEEIKKLDHEHEAILIQVKESTMKENYFNKTERIRMQQWLTKLSVRPNNVIWRKNIIFYLKVMIEMILQGTLTFPFNSIPNEGPLPNLKILDLPYPIRKKFDQSEKMPRNSSKHKNQSVQRLYKKSKSININDQFRIDFDESNLKSNVCHQRRYSSIKSCQVSGKRDDNHKKLNMDQLKLKLTADHNKENTLFSFDSSNITRRLFEEGGKEKDADNLMTYKSDNAHHHNNTICSFEGFEAKPCMKNVGIQLLSKVYKLINQQSFQENDEAQTLKGQISRIADKMGATICDKVKESILSQSSAALLKASENIRLKFSQTNEETMQFMSFLQKFRVKNQ